MRYNGSTQEREEFMRGRLKTTILKETVRLILGMTYLNMWLDTDPKLKKKMWFLIEVGPSYP